MTDGIIYTAFRNYTRFYLSWNLAQQDIPNNRSLINWTVGLNANGIAYWYSNAVRVNSAYVDGQGNLASGTWSNITLGNGQHLPLRSGSVWVYHASDGSKSFGASVSGWLYANGDLATSGSWNLPTIPRNSQVSTNKGSYTLGEPIQIITNRRSTSFTHTITIRLNNGSGTVLQTINSVGDSTVWTPTAAQITQMQNAIPNSNTLNLHITQLNNQVNATSTASRPLNLTDAQPVFADFTFCDSNAAVAAITGDNQVLVKGKSTLETTISSANKMTAVKGSTPGHYSIIFDGETKQQTYSASSSVVSTFDATTAGSRTIIASAFDSRGNNTSVSKTVTVYDYAAPTITATLTRHNNFADNTTVTISGTYTPLSIGGTNKNALTTGSLQYRYREQGGTYGSWVTRAFTAVPASGTYTVADFVVALDNTKKFEFEFRLNDAFGQVTSTNIVDVGVPIMFVGENDGSPAIGLGVMPEPGVALQVGENFKVDDSGDVVMSGRNFYAVTSNLSWLSLPGNWGATTARSTTFSDVPTGTYFVTASTAYLTPGNVAIGELDYIIAFTGPVTMVSQVQSTVTGTIPAMGRSAFAIINVTSTGDVVVKENLSNNPARTGVRFDYGLIILQRM